jgi:purine-binding chemotaxis protein CheW
MAERDTRMKRAADLARRVSNPPTSPREKRLRKSDRGPLVEHLAFCLGADVYGAPVALVREILKPPPLTPVPRTPREVMGIISVRGQLVTVFDLRRKLRLPEAPITRRSRVLLVQARPEAQIEGARPQAPETLGLYVDEVLSVYRLHETEIEGATTALGGDGPGFITGIARPASGATRAPTRTSGGADTSLIILLDLPGLLAS